MLTRFGIFRRAALWAAACVLILGGMAVITAFAVLPGPKKEIRALMAAGRNPVQYIGSTSATYTGALGGIGGANAKCNAEGGSFAGSHMCTQDEALRTGATSFGLSQGWIMCTINYTGHQGEVGPTYFWSSCSTVITGTSWVNPADTLSCGQWTNSGSGSTGPTLGSSGSITEVTCDNTRAIHCCK